MAKKGIYQRYACKTTYIQGKWEQAPESRPGYICSCYFSDGLYGTAWNGGFTAYKNYSFSEDLGYSVSYCTGTFKGGADFETRYVLYNGYLYSVKNFMSGGSNYYSESRIKAILNYSRGTYLTDIIADYGSLPTDGRHSDGYWYVFVKMASDLKGNINGVIRDMPEGWAYIDGFWKPQSELKANVNGIYR